jgi:hypothetical protein
MKNILFAGKILVNAMLLPLFFILILSACKKSNVDKLVVKNDGGGKIDTAAITKITYINPIANANAAYDAFLRAFMVKANGQTYIVDGLNKRDRAYFWGQGFMITAIEDAYERTKTADRKQLINDLLTSFLTKETSDWSWNSWNDDIAWVTIACIRGYQITGNTAFKDAAIKNWNFAFDRGWDNVIGGGIWENMDKYTKASLSNDPMIIAGTFIYESTGDASYLNKCKQIYNWVRSSGIYDATTGVVNEAKVNDGSMQYSDNAYNTGSFINAAAALYKITKDPQYLNDAILSANHVVNKFGVMNQEADGCARGIAKLARENNLGDKYYPWLVRQCIASWNNRGLYTNITNNDWRNPTPAGTGEQFAMQCISAVTVQAVTPETKVVTVADGTYKLLVRSGGQAFNAVDAGTANNTTLNVADYNGGNNQRWTLTSLGDGIYKFIGAGSGRSLNVSGNSGDDNAKVILWDYNEAGNEKIYLSSPANGYYAIYFVNSGKVIYVAGIGKDVSIVQSAFTGDDKQQWQFKTP